MKKVALIFIVAMLLPSLVLAWLAVRSLLAQSIVQLRKKTGDNGGEPKHLMVVHGGYKLLA